MGLLGRLLPHRRAAPAPEAATREDTAAPSQPWDAATRLAEEGRLDEAEAALRLILAARPSDFRPWEVATKFALQKGEIARTASLLREAIDRGSIDAALRCDVAAAEIHIGQLATAERRLLEAMQSFSESLRPARMLADVFQRQGREPDARRMFEFVLARDPNDAETLTRYGHFLRSRAVADEAETAFQRALAMAPDLPDAWEGLGMTLVDVGRLDEAEQCFLNALDLDAGRVQTRCNLGFVQYRLGRHAEAETSLNEALARAPAYADALVNLVELLQSTGRRGEAETRVRHFLASNGADERAGLLLARLLQEAGNGEAAEKEYRKVLGRNPDSPRARYDFATFLLKHDRYEEGFVCFESRFAAFPDRYIASSRAFGLAPERRWKGDSLAGKRLLLWAEQGFGDALMMMRYVPLLRALGPSNIALRCAPPLRRLMAGFAGIDVTSTGLAEANGAWDVHCALMSLPHVLGTRFETVPPPVRPVLPTDAFARMRASFHPSKGIRVGLAWAGSPALHDDAARSVRFGDLVPLLDVAPATYVSLQKGAHAVDAGGETRVDSRRIDACDDFFDTACLIDCLDLVITVDTAVAHLAGTLGKPVWMLNRAGSEWRWGLVRNDSAWYPSLRLYRQQVPGEWRAVVEALQIDLQERAQRVA